MTEKLRRTIMRMCKVPGYPGVYVLGCFARYVTLYSQQVRAINLIAALCEDGQIHKDTKVAVIGAGAAGLTAAAAAAVQHADVLLLEEYEGFMELQRNNRQRWIHPHIYDWPDMEFDGDDAKLPLLNWTAGYAENVVRQIERGWDAIAGSRKITVRTQATSVVLDAQRRATKLTYSAPLGAGDDEYPVIILAVGFGLEPETEYEDSYWTEDDIDGSFRKSNSGQDWLISGSGDGAFTDLMRLCIRRFRHAEIKDMFTSEPGYLGVIDDLREIHAKKLSDKGLSDEMKRISAPYLMKKLESRLRKDRPNVHLTAKTHDLFGSGASILNRLIVSLLYRMQPPAFTFVPGPYVEAETVVDPKTHVRKHKVTFGQISNRGKGRKSQAKLRTKPFDRVIVRHGPRPKKLQQSFDYIWEATAKLRDEWTELPHNSDVTRKRHWNPTMFPEIRATPETNAFAEGFQRAVKDFGVRAAALTIHKELRSDGSSTIRYEIDKLSVEGAPLSGIRICYESTTGYVGPLVLDASAKRLGIRPEDDYQAPQDFADPLDRLRDRARKLAVILHFPQALRSSDPPLSFGVSFTLLNGDAMSKWEFDQLYGPEERIHLDRQKLEGPTEFLARVVCFPVENLRTRITLPDRIPGPPLPSIFSLGEGAEIDPREIVHGGILQFSPPSGSKFDFHQGDWKPQARKPLLDAGRLTSAGPQRWDLTIYKPKVGFCYSLDWGLAPSDTNAEWTSLDEGAAKLRDQLLRYAWLRRTDPGNSAIAKPRIIMERLYDALYRKYGMKRGGFAVMLMTYEPKKRRLVVVDDVEEGGEPKPGAWTFQLPFGLGLAGACFKQGERVFVYRKPSKQDTEPNSYLPVEGTAHDALIAIPLRRPGAPDPPTGYEPGRQCVGVLNIGSRSAGNKLKLLQTDDLKMLRAQCQGTFDKLVETLGDLSHVSVDPTLL